jgi:hypothetical protein
VRAGKATSVVQPRGAAARRVGNDKIAALGRSMALATAGGVLPSAGPATFTAPEGLDEPGSVLGVSGALGVAAGDSCAGSPLGDGGARSGSQIWVVSASPQLASTRAQSRVWFRLERVVVPTISASITSTRCNTLGHPDRRRRNLVERPLSMVNGRCVETVSRGRRKALRATLRAKMRARPRIPDV